MKPPGWTIYHGVDCQLLPGELILCQNYHGHYACSCGGVAMSNTDRIDSSTQVLAVRCVCDRGHVLSCQALNVAASQGPSSSGTYRVLKAPGHGYLWPGCVPSQGGENLQWADRW
jgi:hypothetical protein